MFICIFRRYKLRFAVFVCIVVQHSVADAEYLRAVLFLAGCEHLFINEPSRNHHYDADYPEHDSEREEVADDSHGKTHPDSQNERACRAVNVREDFRGAFCFSVEFAESVNVAFPVHAVFFDDALCVFCFFIVVEHIFVPPLLLMAAFYARLVCVR